ncbi:MAG TPA: hypothetical protein VF719_02650, partial [Abditibacteriaceae bacterium]
LLLPPLLLELVQSGRWRQPTDEKIQSLIPFLREPVDFTRFGFEETWGYSQLHLVDDPRFSSFFQEYRGSAGIERELPWLDAEKAVFIAVNREIGDDIGIALDYRTNASDPRVVASDWGAEYRRCDWRLVDERFSDFVRRIDL